MWPYDTGSTPPFSPIGPMQGQWDAAQGRGGNTLPERPVAGGGYGVSLPPRFMQNQYGGQQPVWNNWFNQPRPPRPPPMAFPGGGTNPTMGTGYGEIRSGVGPWGGSWRRPNLGAPGRYGGGNQIPYRDSKGHITGTPFVPSHPGTNVPIFTPIASTGDEPGSAINPTDWTKPYGGLPNYGGGILAPGKSWNPWGQNYQPSKTAEGYTINY